MTKTIRFSSPQGGGGGYGWILSAFISVLYIFLCSRSIDFKDEQLLKSEKGTWRNGRAPDCLTTHACVPGLNTADHEWGFQRNILVSPFSMWLEDHVSGGLVKIRLRPVYRQLIKKKDYTCECLKKNWSSSRLLKDNNNYSNSDILHR